LQKPNITPALELGQVIPIGEAAACQGQEEAGRTMLEKPMDEVKGGAVKDDLAIIEHQQEGAGQPQKGVEERKETRFLGNERGIGQEGFQSQGQPSQEAPGVPILPLEGIPYEGAEGVSELVQQDGFAVSRACAEKDDRGRRGDAQAVEDVLSM